MKTREQIQARIAVLESDERAALRAVATAARRSEYGGSGSEAARYDLATIRAQLAALRIALGANEVDIRRERHVDQMLVQAGMLIGVGDNGDAWHNAQARIVSWDWCLGP